MAQEEGSRELCAAHHDPSDPSDRPSSARPPTGGGSPSCTLIYRRAAGRVR